MPRLSFFIFCSMFFALSFGVAAMAALVPSIATNFGVSLGSAMKLTWLYMLPYGLVALIWAPLTRVTKVKRLLLFTSFGFFISALCFSLSSTIGYAYLFRFLTGCFACGFVPLALITIGKTIPSHKKGKYIGTFFGVAYVSTFISVFLSGFLNWRVIYLIPSLLSLGVFILVLTHLKDFDFRKPKFKISYLQTFKEKEALRFFLVIMLASFLYHGLQQRLGMYLHQQYSLQQIAISAIFTVSTLSAIIFEFSGGFLSSRLGNIKIAKIGFILMSVFSLALFFIRDYKFIFVGIILWGSGWALTHVGLSAHLTNFPDKILRDASSLNSALRFSFGGLGAFMGGVLVSIANFKVLFIAVALSVFFLGFNLNKIITVKTS
ncbi:MAG: MFS transporter [Omnitrophica bacterium]|nr:MFS transporter [Candidatus Omnitrophota bacterium]